MSNLQEMLSQLDVSKAAARQMSYGIATTMLATHTSLNSLDLLKEFKSLSDGLFAVIMDNGLKDTQADEKGIDE